MINEQEKQLKASILEDIVIALKELRHAFNKEYRFIRILEAKIKEYKGDNKN